MKEEITKEDLFKLVLFELEKYCNNVANHPLVSDEANYADLRTDKAHFHRAIHWHLSDNGLVYQKRGLRLDIPGQEYAIMWFLKNFDKKKLCQEIMDKYETYLALSPKIEKVDFVINYNLETALKEKGKERELGEIFESLKKKYDSDADLVISEYNKSLTLIYAKMVYRKK